MALNPLTTDQVIDKLVTNLLGAVLLTAVYLLAKFVFTGSKTFLQIGGLCLIVSFKFWLWSIILGARLLIFKR